MKKSVVTLLAESIATSVALTAALFAIVVPILLALDLAHSQGLASATNRALAHARDVLRQSDMVADQVLSATAKLSVARADAPCSDQHLAAMRAAGFSVSLIQAMDYVSKDHLLCSSLGRHGAGIPLGPSGSPTSTGFRERVNVVLPFAPDARFSVIERHNHVWPGRPAMTSPEIQAELRACAGGQFDPVLVERFLQALAARVGLADVQGEG